VPANTEEEIDMAQQASLVQEGVDRFRETLDSIDARRARVQKRLQKQRKSLEKQLESGRKDIEKRTRKQVKRLQTEMRKSPVLKRFESLRKDVSKQFERRVESLLDAFQIASKSDVNRIDRKLGQINRKLKDLEEARKQMNGGSPAAH
jgi:hypothetical protein